MNTRNTEQCSRACDSIPDEDVLTRLAAVNEIVLQHNPDACRNVVKCKTVNLLLNKHLLVVTAVGHVSSCESALMYNGTLLQETQLSDV